MKSLINSAALVTGGNRGLGRAFVSQLLAIGARKVYATSRSPQTFDDPRIVNIVLDVNDSESIARLPSLVPDVTIVINNAGIIGGPILTSSVADIRRVFETNVFGPIQVAQVMAPILKVNGGGALIDIHSALSWIPFGSYGATKAALWSVTNALRQELQSQGTQVVGVHVGFIDTDMTSGLEAPKSDPVDVARAVLEALQNGATEVLVDEVSRQAKSLLSGPVEALRLG